MLLPSIPPWDERAAAQARQRQNQLTKPQGSLGRLEDLAVQLAALTGNPRPEVERPHLLIFAADHGVTAEGVSAYPREVTAQMVFNFLRGGAAISVLARHLKAPLTVVDVGVAAELPPAPGLRVRKVAPGTRNFVHTPAMTPPQAEQAVRVGLEEAQAALAQGAQVLLLGEMGIGNTTAAAALACALQGFSPQEVVGRGTGVDEAGWRRKVRVVEAALARHRPAPQDPWQVLTTVGGLEIGALAGAMIAAASQRVPVLLDGFIVTAAALLAEALAPGVRHFLIAGHVSQERGHARMLQALGLRPLLNLEMRLGEGSGAAVAYPIVQAAARLHAEMATFAEAGVAQKEPDTPGTAHPNPDQKG